MDKRNPFLSARTINRTEDYQPFYHSKAYLKQKIGSLTYFKDQIPQLRKIAEKVGYKDFNQFIKHRKSWHKFAKKIPISYLKAIKTPLYPASYIIQTRPIPLTKKIPENISEAEAVELVKKDAILKNKSC